MTRSYKDLSNRFNSDMWTIMLDKARRAPSGYFSQFESDFVNKMILHDNNDRPMWNPSLKQWNYLHTLVSGL